MTYVQLYIPIEISREIVCLLGNLGTLMFRDLNKDLTAFQRGYVGRIRRLDEAGRLVDYMQQVSQKHAEATWKYVLHTDEEGNDIQRPSVTQLVSEMQTDSHDIINAAMDEIYEFEGRVRRLDDSLANLKEKLNGLLEQRYVIFEVTRFLQSHPGLFGRMDREERELREVDEFRLDFDQLSETLSDAFSFEDGNETNGGQEQQQQRDSLDDQMEYDADQHLLESGFHDRFMLAGSIRRDKVEVLNRILWRLLRGNLIFQNFAIDEPLLANVEKVEKDCFFVFTHGELLLQKVQRVVDSLNGKVVSFAHCTHKEVQNLNERITEIEQITYATESTLHAELLVVSDQLPIWNAMVKREKYIYATLNLFKQESHGLVAEGWLPSLELATISSTMKNYSDAIGSEYSTVVSVIHTDRAPPTYHRTNKFTVAFQSICDAYGIATYKEVNAGLATIVTFPFMFAIMFGDLGHGFILMLIGFYLLMMEKKFEKAQRGEIFDIVFTGRYVITLMGAFSVYTGLLYNDIFSKSMTIFRSGWKWPSNFKEGENIAAKSTGTYPFGLDYAWHGTDNGLIFTNSYKMKLSVIMGFIHMTYSFLFSYVNYRYKKSKVDIIGNFLPGFIFMQSIFGYLTWAILYKWTKDWVKDEKPAPSLLNMLINMFLSPGHIDDQLYTGQKFLQLFLLFAALACIPWLLLYKPLTLKKQHSGVGSNGYESVDRNEGIDELTADLQAAEGNGMVVTDYHAQKENEEFNFGEVLIHQVIHTIEFCLNCISHTASYLRLWALSLAHAQLSSVLWEMTIKNAFSPKNSGSPFAVTKVVVLFAMWFVLTVCILVLMEGTSAMLHSLRLHWVEAMSKFFEGDGYPYEPFTFKNLVE